MLKNLIAALRKGHEHLHPEDLLDALWLAQQRELRLYLNQTEAEPKPAPKSAKTTPLATEPPAPIAKPPAPKPIDESPRPAPASATPAPLSAFGDSDEPSSLKASPINPPASSALPQRLELARSLRPFRQPWYSPVARDLDADPTVERSAEYSTKNRLIVHPVFQARRERWFEATLIVDDSPSMPVWNRTLAEFAQMLQQTGAFRDVRIWRLEAGPPPVLRSASGARVNPSALSTGQSNKLIFFATQGVSANWTSGFYNRQLVAWAKRSALAILHLLPAHLWKHTDLGEPQAIVRAMAPGLRTGLLDVESSWLELYQSMPLPLAAVPVVSLDPRSMGNLAQTVMARGKRSPAFLLQVPSEVDLTAPAEQPTSEVNYVSLVSYFRNACSKEAHRLAVYLSVSAFTLPVARLIQEVLLGPAARQSQLAEILLSGLLRKRNTTATNPDPEEVFYEFYPEAQVVLRNAFHEEEARTLAANFETRVSALLAERWGKPVSFRALVADPNGNFDLPQFAQPFARLGTALLGIEVPLANPNTVFDRFLKTYDASTVAQVAALVCHIEFDVRLTPNFAEKVATAIRSPHDLFTIAFSSRLLLPNGDDSWTFLPTLAPKLRGLAVPVPRGLPQTALIRVYIFGEPGGPIPAGTCFERPPFRQINRISSLDLIETADAVVRVAAQMEGNAPEFDAAGRRCIVARTFSDTTPADLMSREVLEEFRRQPKSPPGKLLNVPPLLTEPVDTTAFDRFTEGIHSGFFRVALFSNRDFDAARFAASRAHDCMTRRRFPGGICWHDGPLSRAPEGHQLHILVRPSAPPSEFTEPFGLILIDPDFESYWEQKHIHFFEGSASTFSPRVTEKLNRLFGSATPGLQDPFEEEKYYYRAAIASLDPPSRDELFILCVLRGKNIDPVLAMFSKDRAAEWRRLDLIGTRNEQSFVREFVSTMLQEYGFEEDARLHHDLVNHYLRSNAGQDLLDIPNDGYFENNIIHHLKQAGRSDLVDLLASAPEWWERRIAHSPLAVSADLSDIGTDVMERLKQILFPPDQPPITDSAEFARHCIDLLGFATTNISKVMADAAADFLNRREPLPLRPRLMLSLDTVAHSRAILDRLHDGGYQTELVTRAEAVNRLPSAQALILAAPPVDRLFKRATRENIPIFLVSPDDQDFAILLSHLKSTFARTIPVPSIAEHESATEKVAQRNFESHPYLRHYAEIKARLYPDDDSARLGFCLLFLTKPRVNWLEFLFEGLLRPRDQADLPRTIELAKQCLGVVLEKFAADLPNVKALSARRATGYPFDETLHALIQRTKVAQQAEIYNQLRRDLPFSDERSRKMNLIASAMRRLEGFQDRSYLSADLNDTGGYAVFAALQLQVYPLVAFLDRLVKRAAQPETQGFLAFHMLHAIQFILKSHRKKLTASQIAALKQISSRPWMGKDSLRILNSMLSEKTTPPDRLRTR